MKLIGFLFGLIALLAMLIAFIPMLGWLNWIVIPFAIIGLIISGLTGSKTGRHSASLLSFLECSVLCSVAEYCEN